jgi:hypothetical protein
MKFLIPLALIGATALAIAADDVHRSEKGHQHGLAELQVVIDGNELNIALDGPAANVLGFEHAPTTAAQKKTVRRVEQQLRQTETLFTLPKAARCESRAADVELRLPAAGSGESHSDVEVEWHWRCGNIEELKHIDVGLFRAFPNFKELNAALVLPQGQKAASLSPRKLRLSLTP